MDFTIYSMGDPDFIRLALLGLSHAFEQGALVLAKIGLLLGLLVVFWKGAWEPGKVEFKNFFIGFFLVVILFGKNVEVTLIHNDGLGADAMPPIPIGIAFAATLSTNLGHSLAGTLRDFYHTTILPGGMTPSGYRNLLAPDGNSDGVIKVAGNGLDPLRELMKLRFDGNLDTFEATSAYNAANATTPGIYSADLSRSIQNYMADCVLKDLYNPNFSQEVNEALMKTSPYAWTAMKVDYNGWTTTINIDAGTGWEIEGCGIAYDKIESAINSDWKAVTEQNGSMAGAIDGDLVLRGQSMLQNASLEAWKVKVNQVLLYHFKKAKASNQWASEGELLASQAEFEALDKRRVSSTTQFSLWSEMAIPLITYIESFVYLVGPLMPFIIAFGEKGAGMVVKYFLLLVWVNTWPILQVGVNMYLQTAINKASFNQTNYDAFSWAGYNTSFTEIESFIAMGSTLQTMVPALSLMLLYGSVHTAINLSNGAQKGGGSEGANITPKAMGAADSGKSSVGNNSAAYDKHAGGFIHDYGGSSSGEIGMKQFNTANQASTTASNNLTAARGRSLAATNTASQAFTEMSNSMEVGSSAKAAGQSNTANMSRGMQRANAYAQSLNEIHGLGENHAKTLGLALSGGLGVEAQASAAAALGLGKGEAVTAKFGAAVSGKASIGAQSELKEALGAVASINKQSGNQWNFSATESGQAVLAAANNYSSTNSTGNQVGFGESGQKLEQAATQYAESQQAIEQNTRALAQAQSISGSNAFTMAAVTSDSKRNKVDEGLLDGTIQSGHARDMAMHQLSKNPEQLSKFNEFKQSGMASGKNYGGGVDGDIRALQDFSKTKDGQSLNADALKTSSIYADEARNFVRGDVGENSSGREQMASLGRYADQKFTQAMNENGNDGFVAGAKLLDTLNDKAGGGIASWKTAAADLRSVDASSKNGVAMPNKGNEGLPVINSTVPTKSQIESKVDDTRGDSRRELKGIKGEVKDDTATVHQNNVDSTKTDIKADPKKQGEASGIIEEVAGTINQGKDNTKAIEGALKALAPTAEMALKTADELTNGTLQEQATANIAESNGVPISSAAMITGTSGSDKQHTDIATTIGSGFAKDATEQERMDAIGLVAASLVSASQISALEAGSSEEQALAETMKSNIASVNTALSQLEGGSGVIGTLAEGVANKDISLGAASGAVSMMNDNNYNPTTPRASRDAWETTDMKMAGVALGVADNIAGGRLALSSLDTNSSEYSDLSAKIATSEAFLANNQESYAIGIAQRAYNEAGGDSSGHSLIRNGALGNDTPGLQSMSITDTANGNGDAGWGDLFTGDSGSNTQMGDYETYREAAVAAVAALDNTPGMSRYADNLNTTISRLDDKGGFN